jgi:hypothetical protein
MRLTVCVILATVTLAIYAIAQDNSPVKVGKEVLSGQVVDDGTGSHHAPQLKLRLFAAKSSIRSGEQLKIRVELWNLGTEDVIVAQNLGSTFGNSTLSFILDTGHGGESFSAVGDRLPESTEPDFERTFVTNWLTLNKNHFYGTYVSMDPIEFPHLRKLGRYRVHAQYYSRGISSTPGWNGSFLKQADVDKLPLTAFQGTLDSNDISIQVTAGRQAPD